MKANSHNLESDKLQGKNNKTIGYKQVKDVPKLHKPTAEIEKILLSAVPLKIDVTERLLPPKVAWELSNIKTPGFTTLGTLGNFSLVTGKAKSRKSFFVSIAVGAAVGNKLVLERFRSDLPPKKNNVLYFDTEQGRYHVHLAMCRICKLIGIPTPPNLHVYSLRSKTPAEKLEIIEALIYNNPTIGFVVIDGIRDLVTSINDEEQATMISSKLLKWTEERGIHILTVLHQNKGDNNARGHLGTELINKAETVLAVSKYDRNDTISIVEPQQCRNIEPESFAFEIIDGLPAITMDFEIRSVSSKSQFDVKAMEESKKYQLLEEAYKNGDSFQYGKLKEALKTAFLKQFNISLGNNKIVELITDCKNKGWLLQVQPKAAYTLGVFKKTTTV